MTTRTFRITLPLVVEQEFDDEFVDLDDMEYIKESL